MGLELPKLEPKGGFVEADQDYFLTSDKQTLVEESDPEAAFLLARKGQMIPLETARQYRLTGNDPDGDGVDEGGKEGAKKAFSKASKTK